MCRIRFAPALIVVTMLAGCAQKPVVKSDVDLQEIIQGKTKVLPERHEVGPATYFELSAWANDGTRVPPTLGSVPGPIEPSSVIACVSARENYEGENNARCEITLPAGTFTLKYRQVLTANTSGFVKLGCAGEPPALCRAWVVN